LIPESVAPHAKSLLPRIVELTQHADRGALPQCAKHLDWAAKLLCLTGSDTAWGDATSRLVDHDYGNTDPARGTFWRLWESGLVDPLVGRADAEAAVVEPPADSRAWARGKIIERFADDVADVEWDRVELETDRDRWSPQIRIALGQLDGMTQQRFAPILAQARDAEHLAKLLERASRGVADVTDPIIDLPHKLATVTEDE
jgi:proteasome accessory factor A